MTPKQFAGAQREMMSASPSMALERPEVSANAPGGSPMLLDAAWRIGIRLMRSAEWSSDGCAWRTTTSDPVDVWSRRSVAALGRPWIYQGTAGIALFLSELCARTRDNALQRCAEGALERALVESAATSRLQVGFHTGFTGLAYALIRHGISSQQASFVERADSLLASLNYNSDVLGSTDVISGAAGAVPVLLALSNMTASPASRASALVLGTVIVRGATRWPFGWSWPSGTDTSIRDLTGLAHGASGFGHALVELYAATCDAAYKYAAEQAFAYEDSVYNDAVQNWPDFRNGALVESLSSDERRAEFVERLRNGTRTSRSQPRYVRAWCHGAPGIGLARLRAFEVLGEQRYRRTSEMAVATTAAASDEINNYSLCHGIFGNDATLLEASRVLGDSVWETQVVQRAESAVERYEFAERPWPSGTLGNVPDPSLMLGDAGIGYHLLRLADRTVPSVLLPVSSVILASAENRLPVRADVTEYRREHIRVFFARTMDVAQQLSHRTQLAISEGDNPLLAFAECVRAMATAPHSEHAELIADASAPEMARLSMVMSTTDFTDTLIDQLRSAPASDVDWPRASLRLSAFACLVTQFYDWIAWLDAGATSTPSRSDVPIYWLLHRRGGVVVERRLKGLSKAMLVAVGRGGTFEQVLLTVRGETDASVSDKDLRRLVLQIVINAYEAGIITLDTWESVH